MGCLSSHVCPERFILMVVMPVQGAELPHALPSRRSAVVGAIVMQKVSFGPGAMHAGAPSTVPQRASPTRCPLCHATKYPLARGHFLLARSSFPEHGLLVSSSVATSRAAASIILNVASAAATGWIPEVSSIQEEPRAVSGMLDPSENRPTLLGSWVLSEIDAFPAQSSQQLECPWPCPSPWEAPDSF